MMLILELSGSFTHIIENNKTAFINSLANNSKKDGSAT